MSRHYIVVTETDGGRDYEIEHAADCPMELRESALGSEEYVCDVGRIIAWDGLDAFGVGSLDELPLGRSEIEAWYEPARWYGATRSDADGGLRLVEDDA